MVGGQVSVSVLILTLNEADNLPRCLDALAEFDDILVLDSGSTDGTREVAAERGVRVIQRPFDDFSSQRNYGIDHGELRHAWVLHLDADEVVTPALVDEIRRVVESEVHAAYRIPSKLMFMDRWLRYSSGYPVYQVRLGRVDRLRFEQVGHGQREMLEPGEIGTLSEPYLHYSFSKGLDDWFERHNRYSRDEARFLARVRAQGGMDWRRLMSADRLERRRAFKQLAAWLPLRPWMRLLQLFVLQRGFLDGLAGWRYCQLMMAYERMIALKYQCEERQRDG